MLKKCKLENSNDIHVYLNKEKEQVVIYDRRFNKHCQEFIRKAHFFPPDQFRHFTFYYKNVVYQAYTV